MPDRIAGRIFRVAAVIALVGETAIIKGQVDPTQLLQVAIDRVKDNTHALRRLTCEERTSRRFYLGSSRSMDAAMPQGPSEKGVINPPLPALLMPSFQGRNLYWSDRVRVELSLFDGKDVFSWPGGGKFDSALDSLVTNGATLSGVLGPFDVSVLLNDADPSLFRYERTVTGFGTTLAEYAYKVPAEKSHLLFPDLAGNRTAVAYEGFFLMDVSSGDLRRLCVELKQFPRNTQISLGAVATDYGPHKIADAIAFIPITSSMRLLFKEGELAVNDMQYVDCHQFQAESTLHFNDLPGTGESDKGKSISEQLAPLPKNRLLKLALNAPIDSNTASTGDLIEAHVMKSLKGKDGQIVVPAGAVVRGRILRLIQYASPYNSVELALRFDELTVGGEAVSIRLSLPEAEAQQKVQDHFSVGDKQRLPVYVVQDKSQLTTAQDDRKNGTGTFQFNHTDHLRLAPGYVTEWTIN